MRELTRLFPPPGLKYSENHFGEPFGKRPLRNVLDWTTEENLNFQLFYDQTATFYAVTKLGARETLQILNLEQAFRWFKTAMMKYSDNVDTSFLEAFSAFSEPASPFEAPEFEFMPLVPENAKPKRSRRKGKVSAKTLFGIQLELATALVEVVTRLSRCGPDATEALADARRRCSTLHVELHSEQAFKLASGF